MQYFTLHWLTIHQVMIMMNRLCDRLLLCKFYQPCPPKSWLSKMGTYEQTELGCDSGWALYTRRAHARVIRTASFRLKEYYTLPHDAACCFRINLPPNILTVNNSIALLLFEPFGVILVFCLKFYIWDVFLISYVISLYIYNCSRAKHQVIIQ